jgi:hypothetical protein
MEQHRIEQILSFDAASTASPESPGCHDKTRCIKNQPRQGRPIIAQDGSPGFRQKKDPRPAQAPNDPSPDSLTTATRSQGCFSAQNETRVSEAVFK